MVCSAMLGLMQSQDPRDGSPTPECAGCCAGYHRRGPRHAQFAERHQLHQATDRNNRRDAPHAIAKTNTTPRLAGSGTGVNCSENWYDVSPLKLT